MELKHEKKAGGTPDNGLLIVPYGIETSLTTIITR